jgi:hypothetical protein
MRGTKDRKKKDYIAWQKSGKSKLAFCKERGLGYHTFVKDCKRFSAEAGVGFSRVELPASSTPRERIEIHEQDGRRVFIPLDAPESIIRMFLKGYARLK